MSEFVSYPTGKLDEDSGGAVYTGTVELDGRQYDYEAVVFDDVRFNGIETTVCPMGGHVTSVKVMRGKRLLGEFASSICHDVDDDVKEDLIVDVATEVARNIDAEM